jgi:hypothetical protein
MKKRDVQCGRYPVRSGGATSSITCYCINIISFIVGSARFEDEIEQKIERQVAFRDQCLKAAYGREKSKKVGIAWQYRAENLISVDRINYFPYSFH